MFTRYQNCVYMTGVMRGKAQKTRLGAGLVGGQLLLPSLQVRKECHIRPAKIRLQVFQLAHEFL